MLENEIDSQLARVGAEGRIGIMAHVVAGFPNLEATRALIHTMAESGVDFIEVQIPVENPVLDGPTIRRACGVSIENGTKVADVLELIRRLSTEVDIPLLVMSYGSPLLDYTEGANSHMNLEAFCSDAQTAGASGLIIPDLPLSKAVEVGLIAASRQHGLHNVLVLPPDMPEAELRDNAEAASGMVYCMLHRGSTGVREQLAPNAAAHLARVRGVMGECATSRVSQLAGFGISRPEHLRQLEPHAQVAAIGSKAIEVIFQSPPTLDAMLNNVASFFDSMRAYRQER